MTEMRIVIDEKVLALGMIGIALGYIYTNVSSASQELLWNIGASFLIFEGSVLVFIFTAMLVELVTVNTSIENESE